MLTKYLKFTELKNGVTMKNAIIKNRILKVKEKYLEGILNIKNIWLLGVLIVTFLFIINSSDTPLLNDFLGYFVGVFYTPLEFILETFFGITPKSVIWFIVTLAVVPFFSGLFFYSLIWALNLLVVVFIAYIDLFFNKNIKK